PDDSVAYTNHRPGSARQSVNVATEDRAPACVKVSVVSIMRAPNRAKSRNIPTPFFGRYADGCVSNGYNVVPVLPGTKQPRYPRWQTACYKDNDLDWLHRHNYGFPEDSVGIACGSRVIGIDIDADDLALAENLHKIASETLGNTPLVRFGRSPRRVLLYRPIGTIQTVKAGKIEVRSYGCQVLAFGIHPDTGQPYRWDAGDPTNTPLEKLPQVSSAQIEDFVRWAQAAVHNATSMFASPMSGNADPSGRNRNRLPTG